MNRTLTALFAAGLMSAALALAESQPAKKAPAPAAPAANPAAELADSMAQRLSQELHVKTLVGEPIQAGSLTVIPIVTVDVGFGGVGKGTGEQAGGFYMSGEARPLGFVVTGKKGTRFISVGKTPAK